MATACASPTSPKRDRADAFRFLANQERTIAQAALRFVLQLQGVSVVIAGISSLKHLEQNLGALVAPPLTDDELARAQSTCKAAPTLSVGSKG